MIEMVYHLQLNEALGPQMKFVGVPLNAKGLDSWFGAAFLFLTAVALFETTRRHFVHQWNTAQEEIEIETKKREAL